MIGDKLRKAREAKNLSIQDMEKETSIRALYIEAIENGNYKILPGEAYLKGFIKSYANTLGLDGPMLVEEYKTEQGQSLPEDEAADDVTEEADKPAKSTASPAAPKIKPVKSGGLAKQRNYGVVGSNRNSRGFSYKIMAGIIGFIICIGVYTFLSADEAPQPTAKPAVKTTADNKPAVSQSQAAVQTPPAAPVKTPAAVPAANNNDIDIDIKLTGRCWLQVEVDNRVVYEGTAQSGEKFSWKGNENVKITAGNAGAIEFVQNGKELGKLGSAGEVITKEFTKSATAVEQKE